MKMRWQCGRCKKKAVTRTADHPFDSRPAYQCIACGFYYTKGYQGHEDDPEPARTRFD